MNKISRKKQKMSILLTIICIMATIGIAGADTIDNNGINVESQTGDQNGIIAGSSVQGLTTLPYDKSLNGGYVAGGVGMRNRGWGTILIKDIPAGSTIDKAYLFWSVLGSSGVITPSSSYAKGKINNVSITGTYLGSNSFTPCWKGVGSAFAYRADVTSLVKGNKLYHLQDFASGYTWGDYEPYVDESANTNKYPMIEGASLVVVYNNSKYPYTRIQIRDGISIPHKDGTSTATFSGWTAPANPIAKTTYIVSDGENFGETVQFNGIDMPVPFLDGKDRQNGNDWKQTWSYYSTGNLQDTNTAYVKVNPGDISATATISNAGDCLAWIAQVFSVYNGVDTDGDALKDAWEAYGYDSNNDNIVDVDLPALGADPFHKDLFIEVDWMAIGPGEIKSHKPDPSVITRTIDTFAKAPYANNPDGKSGINAHIDVSNEVLHDNLIDSWTGEFDTIKNANFAATRQDIYHYSLFAHDYWNVGSSGISRGIPASDFMVTLGSWGSGDTPDAETGTFIHEFGHNLGLKHGGDDHNNYKPNYLSVMNYFFQIPGVYRSGKWGNYDYQRTAPYVLNENALNESNGIGTVGYGTKWYSPGCTNPQYYAPKTSTVYKPINWDYDGISTENSVLVDINCDGYKTTLNSQNNWQNIVYNGGLIGGIGPGIGKKTQIMSAEEMPKELTYEEYKKIENIR